MEKQNHPLRVVVLTHGEAESLLQNLLKLKSVTVAAVVIETDVNRKQFSWREKLRRSIRYDGYLATAGKLLRKIVRFGNPPLNATVQIQSRQVDLGNFCVKVGVPVHFVRNYHTEEACALIRRESPDLGIVWGTNILKESVFKIPRLGSINYHQGLSPYYRGGPPVFWELYNNEPEVGVTVHFVETKVDAGDILAQAKVPLEYDYSYGLNFQAFIEEYRKELFDVGVNMMVEAVRTIAEGTARPWPQDTSLGKRYRLPLKSEKDALVRRLLISDRLLPNRPRLSKIHL